MAEPYTSIATLGRQHRVQPDMSVRMNELGDWRTCDENPVSRTARLPAARGGRRRRHVSKVNGSVRVEAGQTAGDVSTVNGSVTIEEGATAEDVETVNGSITIERNATVQSIESVNGGISLGAGAKAASMETVNGTLRLAEGAQVSGDVSAVNGSAKLAKGADIRGELSNVNGKMTIDAAHVGGGLKTVNGDITVGPRLAHRRRHPGREAEPELVQPQPPRAAHRHRPGRCGRRPAALRARSRSCW